MTNKRICNLNKGYINIVLWEHTSKSDFRHDFVLMIMMIITDIVMLHQPFRLYMLVFLPLCLSCVVSFLPPSFLVGHVFSQTHTFRGFLESAQTQPRFTSTSHSSMTNNYYFYKKPSS